MKHFGTAFVAVFMATLFMILPALFTPALSDSYDSSVTPMPTLPPTPSPYPTPYWINYPPIHFQAEPELPTDECGRWIIDGASLNEVEIIVNGGLIALSVSLKNSLGEPVDVVLSDHKLTGFSELEDGEYTLLAYDSAVPEIAPQSIVFIIDRTM